MERLNTFEGSIVKNGMVPVCLNRRADDDKVIIDGYKYNLEDYPKEEYTPIGIVVMNPLHTNARYQDSDPNKGKYLIMSLKNMDNYKPDNGTVEYLPMCWGYCNNGIPELYKYDKVVTVSDVVNNEYTNAFTEYSSIPTTYNNSGDKCVTAPMLKYIGYYRAPSPYRMTVDKEGLPVWGVNPLYTEGGKEKRNALSDFDGRKNTEIILSKVIYDSKHVVRIPNSDNEGNYPAATCCSRFRTEGTESGDWWLPSCGELGYCATFWKENTTTLEHINKVYGEKLCATNLETGNWSSSDGSNIFARYVSLNCGYVDGYIKSYEWCVHAVLAVEVTTE